MGRVWHFLVVLFPLACASAEAPPPLPVDEPEEEQPQEDDSPLPEDEEPDAPSGCEAVEATTTVIAAAPWGVGDHLLGRPVNQRFESFAGPEGGNLFEDGEVFVTELDIMEHAYVSIDNSRQLAANFSGWGLSGSVETNSSRRYASFRAYQLAEVREIDDTAAMAQAPEGAVWYLSRIYYGHSFEMVVSGESNRFHAGVKANFLIASGSIETFATTNKLTTTAFGRGLEPNNGDAIFATTASDIQSAYTAAGEPVPIFVEYKHVPQACVPEAESYPWLDPIRVTVSYDSVDVYLDGSPGADTWSLDATCKVNGEDVFVPNGNIWAYHNNVSDDCTGGSGPNGDGNYCRYQLFWSTQLDIVAGDELRCGIQGTAHDDNDPVDYSELAYTLSGSDASMSDRMGNGNGNTEYWLNYSLDFVLPEEPETN